MRTWIGATIVAAALAVGAPAGTASAAAALLEDVGTNGCSLQKATDFSARRYHRRYYRYGDRPYYYARPYYYRPYPYYVQAPFPFGFGFGPLGR